MAPFLCLQEVDPFNCSILFGSSMYWYLSGRKILPKVSIIVPVFNGEIS